MHVVNVQTHALQKKCILLGFSDSRYCVFICIRMTAGSRKDMTRACQNTETRLVAAGMACAVLVLHHIYDLMPLLYKQAVCCKLSRTLSSPPYVLVHTAHMSQLTWFVMPRWPFSSHACEAVPQHHLPCHCKRAFCLCGGHGQHMQC